MPDDLEWLLRISELDGGDIGEVVVLLRGIIVQPAHDLAHAARLDIDVGLSPDHLGAHEERAELRRDRSGGRVGLAPLLRNVARSDGLGGARIRAAGEYG